MTTDIIHRRLHRRPGARLSQADRLAVHDITLSPQQGPKSAANITHALATAMPPVLVLLAKTAKQAIPRVKIVAARAVSARWTDWAAPRPAVEPFAFVIGLLLYVWWVAPAATPGTDVVFGTLLGLAPVLSSLAHRDRPRDLGFTIHNLRASAREVGAATAGFTLVILVLGATTGRRFALPHHLAPS